MHALLIDGLNLIRRVHAGVPRNEDSIGHSQAVEEACVASLRRALRRHRPSHALCAMEYERQSWRGTLFPDYKKNRRPMPDDLRSALTQIVSRFLAPTGGALTLNLILLVPISFVSVGCVFIVFFDPPQTFVGFCLRGYLFLTGISFDNYS